MRCRRRATSHTGRKLSFFVQFMLGVPKKGMFLFVQTYAYVQFVVRIEHPYIATKKRCLRGAQRLKKR